MTPLAMSKSKSVGVRGRRRRGRGLGIGGDGGGEGDNEGDREYDNGWTGVGEGPGTKVTMVSMVTDGLSGTATGLLGGPASSKRSQRVCQTRRGIWQRCLGVEKGSHVLLERQGQIPAARPPV